MHLRDRLDAVRRSAGPARSANVWPRCVRSPASPTASKSIAYVSPQVVLEFGTHAEFIPQDRFAIRSFAAEEFPKIGTTRSRVSFFMNCFREHGFIEYNGRIRVHKSLLNVILHDRSFEQNSVSAPLVETGPGQSETALKRAARIGVKVRHHDGLKD